MANDLRPRLQARLQQLESLGLRREGLLFTRLCQQALALAHAGWRIELAHRVPVDEAPVWAFLRDGGTRPRCTSIWARCRPTRTGPS